MKQLITNPIFQPDIMLKESVFSYDGSEIITIRRGNYFLLNSQINHNSAFKNSGLINHVLNNINNKTNSIHIAIYMIYSEFFVKELIELYNEFKYKIYLYIPNNDALFPKNISELFKSFGKDITIHKLGCSNYDDSNICPNTDNIMS